MSTNRSRASLWLGRAVLFIVAAILARISSTYLFDPTSGSAARGMVLSSPLAITIARVGFGAFPLACAIVVAWCLVSVDRLRSGLWFVITVFSTVLIVRVVGALVDHSLSENIPLIVAEIVFLALTTTALVLGARQPGKRSWSDAAAGLR